MISAKDALYLETAKFFDLVSFRYVMKIAEKHIQETMRFGGPDPLEIPFREMNLETCKMFCLAMRRFKWNVRADLLSSPPRVQGAQPEPHHWLIRIEPFPEVYDDLNFIKQISMNIEEPSEESRLIK